MKKWSESICADQSEWMAEIMRQAAESRVRFEEGEAVEIQVFFRIPRPESHFHQQRIKRDAPDFPTSEFDLRELSNQCIDAIQRSGMLRSTMQVVFHEFRIVWSSVGFGGGQNSPCVDIWIQSITWWPKNEAA